MLGGIQATIPSVDNHRHERIIATTDSGNRTDQRVLAPGGEGELGLRIHGHWPDCSRWSLRRKSHRRTGCTLVDAGRFSFWSHLPVRHRQAWRQKNSWACPGRHFDQWAVGLYLCHEFYGCQGKSAGGRENGSVITNLVHSFGQSDRCRRIALGDAGQDLSLSWVPWNRSRDLLSRSPKYCSRSVPTPDRVTHAGVFLFSRGPRFQTIDEHELMERQLQKPS